MYVNGIGTVGGFFCSVEGRRNINVHLRTAAPENETLCASGTAVVFTFLRGVHLFPELAEALFRSRGVHPVRLHTLSLC